jgi:hypothetical protein
MNVEIGAEAALFPGKEYINGIAVAVFIADLCWAGGSFNYALHLHPMLLKNRKERSYDYDL